MTTYAVHYHYSDDTDRRMELRPVHREFLGRLADQGNCLAAGAYAPTERPGGLLILRADSAAAVDELLSADPYRTEGIVTDLEILEWGVALGPVAEQLK